MKIGTRGAAVAFTALVALQAPQIALSAGGDVSNGNCDGMKGRERSLCVRAHATANRVERLIERGSTVARLERAQARLAKLLERYETVFGMQVPGLESAPPCELDLVNDWIDAHTDRPGFLIPGLNVEDSSSVSGGSCTLSYAIEPEHEETHWCFSAPRLTLSATAGFCAGDCAEQGWISVGNASEGNPGEAPESTYCVNYSLGGPADLEGVKACAQHFGCSDL